jgi:hypothetical protein
VLSGALEKNPAFRLQAHRARFELVSPPHADRELPFGRRSHHARRDRRDFAQTTSEACGAHRTAQLPTLILRQVRGALPNFPMKSLLKLDSVVNPTARLTSTTLMVVERSIVADIWSRTSSQ